ncbi:hypothetical protein KCU95_g749, partial [Aureobasidium melanogenum]
MDDKLPYTFQVDASWTAEPEDIEFFGQLVVACAEGHLSPFAAAQKITDELASEAWRNKAYVELHDEDRPYRTHTVLVAVLIGSCASSFPPSSTVHRRLFEMIKSFLEVEKRQIPYVANDSMDETQSKFEGSTNLSSSVPLWESLKPLAFASNWSWLAELGDPWTGAEKCGSHEQQRWRNLSYFSAKIATQGIERLGRQSPLQNLLPRYRALDESTIGWSGHLAGQTLAAAQWFVPKYHASWVWRACCVCESYSQPETSPDGLEEGQTARRSRLHTEDDDQAVLVRLEGWLWNLENWEVWKAAFIQVMERVEDQRIHEVVRREVSKALKNMEEVETIGECDSHLVKYA